MKIKRNIIVSFVSLFLLSACSGDKWIGTDDENAIQFQAWVGSGMIDGNLTRTTGENYVALPVGYTLSMTMKTSSENIKTSDYVADVVGSGSSTLKSTDIFYWPGNALSYGFEAVAGNEKIAIDQNSNAKLISADRLLGYAGTSDSHDALVFKTAKEWKTANSSETIPVFLKHQKSMITVVLKAGEGVSRGALTYNVNNTALSDAIFSYGNTTADDVTVTSPYVESTNVNYDGSEGSGDAASAVGTTQFSAIVEPYNYFSNKDNPITRIVLNNQKYSFYASNDLNASSDVYNLVAGKHLVLTVIIGRAGRVVSMTAQLKDWELVANTDISTDDFGQATDPIVINCAKAKEGTATDIGLYDVLTDVNLNVKGNIFILNNDITIKDINWPTDLVLNATFNLNGHTINTDSRIFSEISSTGTVKNGTIDLTKGSLSAVTGTNNGYLRNIVTKSTNASIVSQAGLVASNSSAASINDCTNYIKVNGTEKIGGIAAESSGTIEGCTNDAKIIPANNATIAGGIVGTANGGVVSNNVNKYGFTLSQTEGTLGNIIGSGSSVTAANNSWPTNVSNDIAGTNVSTVKYSHVLDSQDELEQLFTNGNTLPCRVSADFILSNVWNASGKTLNFILDGNDKTITTNGTMLFEKITGTFSNTTVKLNASLSSILSGTDGMSAVAFTLNGGTIENVDLKNSGSATITASNPAGFVVISMGNAVLSNCVNRIPLIVDNTSSNGNKIYAGGIVAEAQSTTITGCRNTSTAGISMAKTTDGVFVGGIVGALNKSDINDETLKSTITDCSNFYSQLAGAYVGGIVGHTTSYGVTSKCIGNWWTAGQSSVGDGGGSVGNKNAIEPTAE